ncbi:uncharacterized protein LOC141590133 [Silene latifolia]|uniref:uncharacterized protein LOC141590133 n=1 Tax=Silene latifolia TaxID=37657 RepID=UPI003D76EBA1
MNKDKSEIYCYGVPPDLLRALIRVSGFQLGQFPFRYLGIPISYKRISIGDCSKLVEKMVATIKGWGTRKLSYAGRLVLVKSVLSQLHSYWARILIIPKGVIQRIMYICRNYLWKGGDDYHKAPLVSCESLCMDKNAGGLGVVNSQDGTCDLCGGAVETRDHLFFMCPFNSRCLKMIGNWLELDIPEQETFEWCRKLRLRSLMQKQIIIAAILALLYQIWWSRNICRLENLVIHP